MEECIPEKMIREKKKSTHPWLTDRATNCVAEKMSAVGADREEEAVKRCSQVILEERGEWRRKTREAMKKLKRGCKAWWSKAKKLMSLRQKASGIPALKSAGGEWVKDIREKANLFAETFASKLNLPEIEENEYTCEDCGADELPMAWIAINPQVVRKMLEALDEDSATASDKLPAMVLKKCAEQLAYPVFLLTACVLEWGHWPSTWMLHWMVPIYKKKSVCDANNYRGVHMTPQLSKVVERLVALLWVPAISKSLGFGHRQFAHMKGKGSRDAVALLVCKWMLAFLKKKRVAVYCSDVSGAFDKVRCAILTRKLRAKGVPAEIRKLLKSWLRKRAALVVVEGANSEEMELCDMVYQGTVLGPMLWNIFFEDSRHAINNAGFEEIVYADDLNADKAYDSKVDSKTIMKDIDACQVELHKWGRANSVTFDARKENKHILSRHRPYGDNFEILGIEFACKFLMNDAVNALYGDCRWKLRSILRTHRFMTGDQLIDIYKSRLLGFIEYRNPGIYHACDSSLGELDKIQEELLEAACVSERDALLKFNLAPLSARRDIALLGLVHRTMLGLGPVQFQEYFRLDRGVTRGKHAWQLVEYANDVSDFLYPGSEPAEYIQRSILGVARIYNRLPAEIVMNSGTVAVFQGKLQCLLKVMAADDEPCWRSLFSSRVPMHWHRLRHVA